MSAESLGLPGRNTLLVFVTCVRSEDDTHHAQNHTQTLDNFNPCLLVSQTSFHVVLFTNSCARLPYSGLQPDCFGLRTSMSTKLQRGRQ